MTEIEQVDGVEEEEEERFQEELQGVVARRKDLEHRYREAHTAHYHQPDCVFT